MLWRAVLAQAIHDVCSSDDIARRDVIIWMKTRDFVTVCDYADAHAPSMREQIKALSALSRILAQKYGALLRQQIMGVE